MTRFDSSKVLTTGAYGMIGAYIDFGLRPEKSALDILSEDDVLQYVKTHRPDTIVHLAAATDTQKCEGDPLYAYELNVRGTYNIARAARAVDAVMVYVSTSRVFKGDQETPYAENDIPEPTTQYGRTKYIGELITAAMVPRSIIARTAWVFGGGPTRDNKFFGTIIRKILESDGEVVALQDVHGSPTYGKDFIQAVMHLVTEKMYGTYHVTNAGPATRLDIARAVAERIGSNKVVRAVDRDFFPGGTMLPTNESISSTHCILRPWQDALAEYLLNEWQHDPKKV